MYLKKLNPTSSGTRHQFNLMKNILSKNNNIAKKLTFKIKIKAGRSIKTGQITVRHKGGGCKKQFKKIKFNSFFTKNIILMVNYDAYRNSFISLNFDFLVKKFFFSTSVQGLLPGSLITSSKKNLDLFLGNSTFLFNFPISAFIHNVHKKNYIKSLAIFSRAAGTYCQIIQKYKNQIQICLPSGRFIFIKSDTFAALGKVSNTKFNLRVLGKAGKNRLKGCKPKVRGIAMNPIDHPHGGRTNGGRPSVSPWGKLTKGKKTVKKKNG